MTSVPDYSFPPRDLNATSPATSSTPPQTLAQLRASSPNSRLKLSSQISSSPPTTASFFPPSKLSPISSIRPQSISLEQRLSNFDQIQSFDLELGGAGERQVKVSRKAQALLGLGDESSLKGSASSRMDRGKSGSGLVGSGEKLDRFISLSSGRGTKASIPETPPLEFSSSSYKSPHTPPRGQKSPSQPLTAPVTPNGNSPTSKTGPQSPSALNGYSKSLIAPPKEKRGSILGFVGFRKKSTASSISSSSITNMTRANSHGSLDVAAVMEEDEEGEADIENEEFGDGEDDLEELESSDEKEYDDDYFGPVLTRTPNGNKAAVLLGLGGAASAVFVESKGAGSEKMTRSGSNASAISNSGDGAGLPAFPCQKMDLVPHQLSAEQLAKFFNQPSTFLRHKEWKSRYIILTSFPLSTNPPTYLPTLHSFKSAGPLEKELERLELTASTLVFVPEDQPGKPYALRISGLLPRERDEMGQLKRGPRKEESWTLAMDNAASLTEWMVLLKGSIADLSPLTASQTTGRSGSIASGMSRRDSEIGGGDTRSIRSKASSVLLRQPSMASLVDSDSRLGARSPDHSLLYGNRTTSMSPTPPRIRPLSPPNTLHSRPKTPSRDPPTASHSSHFSGHNIGSTISSLPEGDDGEEDEVNYHPYRRPSTSQQSEDTHSRLSVPASVVNLSRRGSDDSGSAGARFMNSYPPVSSSSGHQRDSDLSSLSSYTSSRILPRGPHPTSPLPDTPPSPFDSSRPNSVQNTRTSRSSSVHSKKRTSEASHTSAGSFKSRGIPPALPPPTSALPSLPPLLPPPLPPPLTALPEIPLPPPTASLPEIPHSVTQSRSAPPTRPPRGNILLPVALLPLPGASPSPPPLTPDFTRRPLASGAVGFAAPLPAPTAPLPLPPPPSLPLPSFPSRKIASYSTGIGKNVGEISEAGILHVTGEEQEVDHFFNPSGFQHRVGGR